MTARDPLSTDVREAEAPYDPFLDAMIDFEEAARQLDLEDWIVRRLRHAEREITVNLPLIRDDGQAVTVTGMRVQHNTSRGPTLGPVRLSGDAQLSQTRAAAVYMSWQCALLGIPFGGAAGAMVANPQEFSERELRQLFKQYVNSLSDLVGAHKDVLTLGDGANEQTAAWMLDSDARARGQLELGVVTGKPAVLGGLPASRAAAGRGLFLLLLHALEGAKPNQVRVALQGFGSLGRSVARQLHEAGARVVAVADISGGLLLENGIDIPALAAHARKKGVIFGFTGAEGGCNADVLEASCDVLILAATARQVTVANAARIPAPLIIEAAGGAITRPAEKTLLARGVRIIPDLLGNAGSTVASYLEWKQNVTCCQLTAREIEEALSVLTSSAYYGAHDYVQRHNLSLRRAAQVVAVDRVAGALRLR